MLNCQQAGKLARSATSGQPRQSLSRWRAPLRLRVAFALLASVLLRLNLDRKEQSNQTDNPSERRLRRQPLHLATETLKQHKVYASRPAYYWYQGRIVATLTDCGLLVAVDERVAPSASRQACIWSYTKQLLQLLLDAM